jgi:hypothetical protein
MCYEKQGKNEEALADGAKCISIDPKFVKGNTNLFRCTHAKFSHSICLLTLKLMNFNVKNAGYFRKAQAEENLCKYQDALKTLQTGQKVEWGELDCACLPTQKN